MTNAIHRTQRANAFIYNCNRKRTMRERETEERAQKISRTCADYMTKQPPFFLERFDELLVVLTASSFVGVASLGGSSTTTVVGEEAVSTVVVVVVVEVVVVVVVVVGSVVGVEVGVVDADGVVGVVGVCSPLLGASTAGTEATTTMSSS
jgi:hypothetical protein